MGLLLFRLPDLYTPIAVFPGGDEGNVTTLRSFPVYLLVVNAITVFDAGLGAGLV